MALVRFDPFAALRELDRTFSAPLSSARSEGTWAPRVDVYNRDGAFVVRAEIPGVVPEDIEVTVEGDMLTISGSRRFETETEKDGFHRKEIFEGSFSRRIVQRSVISIARWQSCSWPYRQPGGRSARQKLKSPALRKRCSTRRKPTREKLRYFAVNTKDCCPDQMGSAGKSTPTKALYVAMSVEVA